MPNLIIYRISDGVVRHFIEDAIIFKNSVKGKIIEINASKLRKNTDWTWKWTDETLTPIYGSENFSNEIIGYEENANEITDSVNYGPDLSGHNNRDLFKEALEKRHEIAQLTFTQLENYIENNVVDLPSAKAFLQKISKVMLGIIKMSEYSK